jgi:hypothetical protein
MNKFTATTEQFEKITLTLRLSHDSTANSTTSTNYGFIIAGYCPCHVENVLENSVAERAGVRKGDLIIKINDTNCCRARIKTLLALIKPSSALKLQVHRPLPSSVTINSRSKRNVIIKYDTSRMLARKTVALRKPETKRKTTGIFNKLFAKSWLSCAARPLADLLHGGCVSVPPNNENNNNNSRVETEKCATSNLSGSKTVPHIIESTSQYESCMREFSAISRSDSKKHQIKSAVSTTDTGYESLSRFDSAKIINQTGVDETDDLTIDTVTNTLNSYSNYDMTVTESQRSRHNRPVVAVASDPDEPRTQLIGELIELEANFVTFMSQAVATFSRPLRGFFMKQQDYFTLFQNIEKIAVISENFLRSMDKWSAYDLYTKLGHLYSQKVALFRDALSIYAKGYLAARGLYTELRAHSRQFRLFLNEVQSSDMTLSGFLSAPLVHLQRTLALFKRIRACTPESPRRPSEAPHIDSIVLELRQILAHVDSAVSDDTVFMNDNGSVISEVRSAYDRSSCCSSRRDSGEDDDDGDDVSYELTNCDFSSFFNSSLKHGDDSFYSSAASTVNF